MEIEENRSLIDKKAFEDQCVGLFNEVWTVQFWWS